MKIRVVFVLLSLACAGVANAQPYGPETPCNTGVCAIVVTAATDSNGSCTLSVDKPVLSTKDSVVLVWLLTPDSYVFASNGIVFDNNPTEFAEISQKDQEVKYRDTHPRDQDKYFKYTVNVQGCKALDPYIRNN